MLSAQSLHLRFLLAAALAGLAGCATPPSPEAGPLWHPVTIPGKRLTNYVEDIKGGRRALRADADASASLWRRKVDIRGDKLTDVRWSWWIDGSIPGADLTEADQSDSPARIVMAFDGDRARLPQRTRMMFELARTLSGEEPPYASLMYVWSSTLPVGTVVKSHRSDRIRKIVIDSGPASLGRWREHRRNVAEDFERAFGEPPGRMIGVALMTDADNTGAQARAWYGPIELPR
jgi:Protein of unknown function (DUF3047)